jgi:hypothetical protein
VLALALLCGCAGSAKRAPRLSPSEAVSFASRFLENRIQEVGTVRAGVELHWSSSALEAPASCRGSLLFRAPQSLRLRGTSKAFFTVFDLAVGPDEILIDVPREKVLVRGERNDPDWTRFALNADLISIALAAHPDPSGQVTEVQEWEGTTFYVGDEAMMEIDPQTGLPSRYRRSFPEPAEVTWGEWSEIKGIMWPLRLAISWPETKDSLGIEFGRVQFGKRVRTSMTLDIPPGEREVLTPEQGFERWVEAISGAREE